MRPPNAEEPGPGQESVWDYPRPPRVEPSSELVRIEHQGAVLAETRRALRVLETSQAPAYYLPAEDVDMDLLHPSPRRSMCEWKGEAAYFDVVVGDDVTPAAAWTYRTPRPGFEALADHIAVYPQLVDVCSVDGEAVRPNEGGFYGGWVTSKVVGPFKGAPGTLGW